MSKEPNNKASEEIDNFTKEWFIAIENTSETSPIDIDDFISLLNVVLPKYNLRFALCKWNNERMKKQIDKSMESPEESAEDIMKNYIGTFKFPLTLERKEQLYAFLEKYRELLEDIKSNRKETESQS
jgi:hypothetical protein